MRMIKHEIVKDDGRLFIFYRFGGRQVVDETRDLGEPVSKPDIRDPSVTRSPESYD